MLMSAADYRESLRRYHPVVYVDGKRIESVADEPLLAPGVNGIGVSYDYALRESTQHLLRFEGPDFDGPINRMLAIPRSSADLLNKLEAVRLLCQETGCAQRYLAGDALSAIHHGMQRSMPILAPATTNDCARSPARLCEHRRSASDDRRARAPVAACPTTAEPGHGCISSSAAPTHRDFRDQSVVTGRRTSTSCRDAMPT
jgi:hypothetical protein